MGTELDTSASTETIQREREFYDRSHGRYRRWRKAIWRAIGAFNRNSELSDLYDPNGKRVLLYGCGPANETGALLQQGAVSVAGIDISPREIAQARRQARARGYADRVDFRIGDAHETGFPDACFDLIVGQSIIHHLDVRRALAEIRRILRPGGRAVFLEPLAHNPLLRVGRLLTPAARTRDEHPLTVDDWKSCEAAFPHFRHREVEFASIPLMPFNLAVPPGLQSGLARRVRVLDDRLLDRYPRLRPYARMSHIVLE